MEEIICTIISSGISIIGFIISCRLIKKQKTIAVQQQQNEWQIKEIMKILDDVLNFINDYERMIGGINVNEEAFHNRMTKINNTIICYGTNDSIKIWNYFMYIVYQKIDDNIDMSNVEFIAPLALLVMQIKYDITNIQTSPKTLYIKYSSQKMLQYKFYDKSIEEIKKIVSILNLQHFLEINDRCVF